MPRQNTSHTEASLRSLAAVYYETAQKLTALADRFRKDKIKGSLSLGHQKGLEAGLVSARRFIREANAKLDYWVEDSRGIL